MPRTVIVSGVRTPFGKLGGALSPLTAPQLGGTAIEEAIKQAALEAADVEEVIFGAVLQGGQGQIPSRQAARAAGLPWDVPTETINKVCASGMRSVTLADLLIRGGDKGVIVAGGMESMSNAPYFLAKARWGLKMGDSELKDLMIHDGLTCPFNHVHMGNFGNDIAREYGISRKEQDAWALRSHQSAVAAADRLAEEIVPVEVPQRKGKPLVVNRDEAPRSDTSMEKLNQLPPVFVANGTVTAGNAPGVNDGAGALVLMAEERARQEGRSILATLIDHETVAVDAAKFPETPGLVIKKLLDKTGKGIAEIDLFEINEAFAAVTLASQKITPVDLDKVNVNGGAVALGHPIGASGARIIITLIHELRRRGGGLGVAAICSGGGQGDALMVEVPR